MLQKIHFNRKTWLCILILELIFLVGTACLHRQPPIELDYTQDDLVNDSDEPGFYLDKSFDSNYVGTPEIVLPKGMYTLEAEYEYKGSARIEIYYNDGRVNNEISGVVSLSPSNHISVDFKVKYNNRPMSVRGRLTGDAADGDYILVRNIRIVSDSSASIKFFLQGVLVLILLNGLLYLHSVRSKFNLTEEIQTHFKILLLVVLVCSLPLLVDYLFLNAHDLDFHLTRIEGLKDGLLNGKIPVKIQSNWLGGHGYAVSVFYGDLLLYIPAILRICGLSIVTSYNLYVLLVNIATVFISYYCFTRISNTNTGLICSIVYSLNIFRLYDIYARAAVGEYTAMIFMPLVLYGIWNVYMMPEESEAHTKSWIPITCGCTGIFLTHMISTEMTAIFIILAGIVLWKKTFRKKTFLVIIKAALATVLLSLWFLIPFADFMMNGSYVVNDLTQYYPYRLEQRGAFLAQFFMIDYSVVQQGSAGTNSGTGSEMPLTVGLAAMGALVGWVLLCAGKQRDRAEKKEELLAFFMCALSLWMTTYLFPYTWLVDRIPIFKMFAKSFQYPWRLFAIAAVLLCWLLCIILKKKWIPQKERQILGYIIIFLAFWQGLSYVSDILNECSPYRIYQEEALTSYDVSVGEYIPISAGEEFTTKNYIEQLTYEEGSMTVSDWHRENEKVVVSLTNNTDETQQIEVPLLNYKGYHAITDSGDELLISPGVSHRISVSVPADFSGMIQVGFREPWYWRLCEIISLGALFSMCFYPILQKHMHKVSRQS